MIVSSSCSRPSAVSTPFSVIAPYRVRHELHVRLLERRQVLAREQDALAPESVRRCELRAQIGVGDLVAQVPQGDPLRYRAQPGVHEEGDEELLTGVVDRARHALRRGQGAIERPLELRDRTVAMGEHPRRGALEDESFCTCGWIRGTIWIAEAPVPMTATRSPASARAPSQRAECIVVPAKRSMPSISGSFGSAS